MVGCDGHQHLQHTQHSCKQVLWYMQRLAGVEVVHCGWQRRQWWRWWLLLLLLLLFRLPELVLLLLLLL
jgi:hypothetical protein